MCLLTSFLHVNIQPHWSHRAMSNWENVPKRNWEESRSPKRIPSHRQLRCCCRCNLHGLNAQLLFIHGFPFLSDSILPCSKLTPIIVLATAQLELSTTAVKLIVVLKPPLLIALFKVCVGVRSLTSESFLLPLVPDTLLISSAYIQVISLDVQILVADDVAALIHVTHKSHLISNFCVLIYEQPWVTNSCYWIFASFTKNTKYTLGQNSRICRHAAS